MKRRIFLGLALTLVAATPARADAKFVAFIQTLWPRVKKAGYSRELFDAAFAGITEPDPAVLKLAANQPEFKSTTSEYLDKAVTQVRIDTGKQMLAANGDFLTAVHDTYGVNSIPLLGIWGIESNFGKQMGDMKVLRCLATLMYSGTKKDYANAQLLPAFAILKSGVRTPANFTGSWAGAMGHTQFIPATYIDAAVHWGGGEGKRDIWNSKEDALASTANYLKRSGWKGDRPWGFEVKLPDGFDRNLIGRKHWKAIADWGKLGIKPMTGDTIPAPQAEAFVMIPQGLDGPRFLVTRNFLALLSYNDSHAYALAVGVLGDIINGKVGVKASWPEQKTDLTYAERKDLQQRLSDLGFDTGGADGRFGARTYEAVLGFQKKVGMELDGFPTRKVLERLRAGG